MLARFPIRTTKLNVAFVVFFSFRHLPRPALLSHLTNLLLSINAPTAPSQDHPPRVRNGVISPCSPEAKFRPEIIRPLQISCYVVYGQAGTEIEEMAASAPRQRQWPAVVPDFIIRLLPYRDFYPFIE